MTLDPDNVNVGQLAERWWALVIRGAAAILFGILTLLLPGVSLLVLLIAWAAYALVDGAFNLVLAARDAGARVHICHASTAGTVEILKWARGQGISIISYSQNQEESLKFLKWFIDDFYIEWLHSAWMNFQPARLDIYEDPRWLAHPALETFAHVVEWQKRFLTDKSIIIRSIDTEGPEPDLRAGRSHPTSPQTPVNSRPTTVHGLGAGPSGAPICYH